MKLAPSLLVAASLLASNAQAQTGGTQALPDLILDDTGDNIELSVSDAPKVVQCATAAVRGISIPGSALDIRKDTSGSYLIMTTRRTFIPREQEAGVTLNYDTPDAIHLNHRGVHTIQASAEIASGLNWIALEAQHDGSYIENVIDYSKTNIRHELNNDQISNRQGVVLGDTGTLQQGWTTAAAQTMEATFLDCMGTSSSQRPATAATHAGAPPIEGNAVPLSSLNLTPGVYTGSTPAIAPL